MIAFDIGPTQSHKTIVTDWWLLGPGKQVEMGRNCSMGKKFCFGGIVIFWNWTEVVVSNIVNKLSATELFILK